MAGPPRPVEHYGKQFTCIVCHGHNFLHSVVEIGQVRGLRMEEARTRFIDLPFVASYPALFCQLDQNWVCSTCSKAVDAGQMPALAAKNGLSTTWASLPTYMKGLSNTELEMSALTKVIFSILLLSSLGMLRYSVS